MLKRLGKTITNNFSLKILAVILAVVLWVVVINIDDPTTSKTYTTNVVAENTDYITSQNKYYEPLDSSNVVSFRVSAARSVHDELSNADFSATADMENIEYDEGSGIYRVPVTITRSGIAIKSLSSPNSSIWKWRWKTAAPARRRLRRQLREP